MSALHKCRVAFTHYFRCRNSCTLRRSQHSVVTLSEDNEPGIDLYPPVKPRRPPGIVDWGDMSDEVTWKWHDLQQEEEKLTTIKQKIAFAAQTKPGKAYIYKSVMFQPEHLTFQCNSTKTVLFTPDFTQGPSELPSYGDHEDFPEVYKSMDVSREAALLKPLIINIIEMNSKLYKERRLPQIFSPWDRRIHTVESENSTVLLQQLLSTIIGTLSCKCPHLQRIHFDEDATVAAFWDRAGYKRYLRKEPKKESPNSIKHTHDIDADCRFQGKHNVSFQLRTQDPLPEFRMMASELFSRPGMCPEYKFSPQCIGVFAKSTKSEVTAGYHLGDPCEFNNLSIQLSNTLEMKLIQRTAGDTAHSIALAGLGMSTGFLSTVAQAYNHGFNMFRELTYPFTTQTIVTDGRDFLFQAYQLNTLLLWKDQVGNPVNNFCWGLAPCRLYDTVEEGRVKGFNISTLETLLKFIMLKPEDRGIDLKPYVDQDQDREVHVMKKPLPVSVYQDKTLLYEKIIEKRKFYSGQEQIKMADDGSIQMGQEKEN